MELNPNHPVTQEMHQLWHKIVALLMARAGTDEITITVEEIEQSLGKLNNRVVVAHPDGDVLKVSIVTWEEGERLARKEGGLPH